MFVELGTSNVNTICVHKSCEQSHLHVLFVYALLHKHFLNLINHFYKAIAYPFSPFRIAFVTSFTPRLSVLCLAATVKQRKYV